MSSGKNYSQYKRKYDASPQFTFTNTSIIVATTGEWAVDFAEHTKETQKYLPFNFTVISNMSTQNILFYPNASSKGKFVPASSVIAIDKKTIPTISSFIIRNKTGTNVGAEEIEVAVSREAYDTQDLIKNIHKMLKGFG